jgi:hypothetical protein
MEKSELKEVTRQEKQIVEFTCDLCDAKAKLPGQPWSKDSSDIARVEVSLRTGWARYGDGFGEIIHFDICPDCFTNKLVPWFIEQGATAYKEDWYI